MSSPVILSQQGHSHPAPQEGSVSAPQTSALCKRRKVWVPCAHKVTFLGYIIGSEGVAVVTNWSVPTTIKKLVFFGLHQLLLTLHGFSSIASPLTNLLKKGTKKLQWNPSEDQAFSQLKEAFITAHNVKHHDLSKQFIVEVDASEMGVGAILSQHSGEKPKLHPVAFFSWNLSSVERNYNICNGELLAVKRLNSCQEHWALFIACFDFTLSYCSGSKNIKDSLSHMYPVPAGNTQRSTSYPNTHLGHCQRSRGFRKWIKIWTFLRDKLIMWAHTSLALEHPSTCRTHQLLQGKYWWPQMLQDIQRFISSCLVCAKAKVLHTLPVDKLLPLPTGTSERPCSHLAIDFIINIPSQGKTVIMVIMDQFSYAWFLSLECHKHLKQHAFLYFGNLEDIVSGHLLAWHQTTSHKLTAK